MAAPARVTAPSSASRRCRSLDRQRPGRELAYLVVRVPLGELAHRRPRGDLARLAHRQERPGARLGRCPALNQAPRRSAPFCEVEFACASISAASSSPKRPLDLEAALPRLVGLRLHRLELDDELRVSGSAPASFAATVDAAIARPCASASFSISTESISRLAHARLLARRSARRRSASSAPSPPASPPRRSCSTRSPACSSTQTR